MTGLKEDIVPVSLFAGFFFGNDVSFFYSRYFYLVSDVNGQSKEDCFNDILLIMTNIVVFANFKLN